jgi:predicted DNA-binding transcriptional regulator YafY
VSHDTDKLIRQLSLVAFLMAERRPLTARDIKGTVEGYSEMSDEAFARRFYSDRTELIGLGVPLHSQRDEFTGEELYTLRSEQYFLPRLDLKDDEFAALQTALYLLEGQFAYSEPLRLALQNLALGRASRMVAEAPERSVQVELRDPDYNAEMSGRLTKLEAAISKQRTVKFSYWTLSRNATSERTIDPYALLHEQQSWYVIGYDHDRKSIRTFRVSRIRGDIRFATRRERDFRLPDDFEPQIYRGRQAWQYGDAFAGEAEIELDPDTAWWAERAFSARSRVEDGVLFTEYVDVGPLAGWVLRQEGRARPVGPQELVHEVKEAAERVAALHEGEPSKPARVAPSRSSAAVERPSGPVAPERFGVLQALLAHLLVRCGEERSARIPAEELTERFHIPPEELEDHLQLLNLVNFGGGCYAVYATLHDGEVHVDKELFGDTFRRPPRLTPLEARAIRLALDFVGPMIAAEAHTPLDRVRRKLEETFGEFDLRETPEPRIGEDDETLIRTFSRGIEEHRLVQIEYVDAEGEASERTVEPYSFERELPNWYVHSWDRSADGERSFRFDRVRRATLLDETFEPRPGLALQKLRDATTVRVLFSGEAARRRLERPGATALVKGQVLAEERVGGVDWLVGEILNWRGEAEVLEPAAMRKEVARRARALARKLRPARRTPARATRST